MRDRWWRNTGPTSRATRPSDTPPIDLYGWILTARTRGGALTVGVVVAVWEELRAILRKMPLTEVESVGGILFYRGAVGDKRVVAARSGMGAERAAALVELLAGRYSPDWLIIAGFGAGLAEEIAPGDLVLASMVEDRSHEGFAQVVHFHRLRPDAVLLAHAEGVVFPDLRVHRGGLLTVGSVLRRAADKGEIRRASPDFSAADMETAGAAAAAETAGIPWIAVRAITDGVKDDLPFDFQRYTDPRTGE